ncbi:MAG: DsrE family protein [Ignavibacteriaceae bacterium]
MKKLFSLLFLFTILFSSLLTGRDSIAQSDPEADGILIHISSGHDNPHRVVMALKMATIMAEDKAVLVYLDINGIDVVLKDSEDISYPTFPTSHESIKILLEKGINIYACPSCMQAAGKTAEDLMDGIKIAKKDIFFNFTKGRIVTIDY